MYFFAVLFTSCGDSLEPIKSISVEEPPKKFVYGYDEDSVDIIGGCCGTTPEHIKAMAKLAAKYKPREIGKVNCCVGC